MKEHTQEFLKTHLLGIYISNRKKSLKCVIRKLPIALNRRHALPISRETDLNTTLLGNDEQVSMDHRVNMVIR